MVDTVFTLYSHRASELILIDYQGNIRSYYVSPTEGYQESHVSSFSKVYPNGITAVADRG